MRVVCRELLAQGVTHALIDYDIRAGDKDVEDVTCWRDRLLLDFTAWPAMAEPEPERMRQDAPVSLVALVQRLVFRVMPHHRLSLNSDNLFGTATLEVATQRLVFRSHHQPDAFHYIKRDLPLGDLPSAL